MICDTVSIAGNRAGGPLCRKVGGVGQEGQGDELRNSMRCEEAFPGPGWKDKTPRHLEGGLGGDLRGVSETPFLNPLDATSELGKRSPVVRPCDYCAA